MKVQELLNEHVVNAFDSNQKFRYAAEVWDLLQASYANAGGFKSASSVAELIDDSGLWKLVTRDGKVTAVSIYKDKFGRKGIASGTDGSTQGKKDYLMIKGEDIKLKRSWSEVSGAPEKIMTRLGAKPIPNKYAQALTGKHILNYNDDGFHYTRLIAGHPHEKVIMGFVRGFEETSSHNITDELQNKLSSLGISLHELDL